jgi:hypothetical protein
MLVVAFCLVGVSCLDDVAGQDLASDSKAIEGLWSGSWGGDERDGVVFQPVRAELMIEGDHIELYGFRNVNRLTGTVRFDAGAKRMRITPAAAARRLPAPKAIDYTYDIKGDKLTLIDGDKVSVTLQRHPVAQDPLANAQVEFVAATEINDAGDLNVTEFAVLRAGRTGAIFFQPAKRSLKTQQATVLLVQDTGLKKITMAEARGYMRKSTPVVVAYRHEDRPSLHQLHDLWKDMGSPMPDSEAVGQTFARVLRPGTLVFILSARENVPQP